MKILGVHEGHNASASLLEDGEIRAAISEERINRIKYWEGVPEKAVIRVLQITDTKPEDVDMVVFSYLSEPINMAQISGEQFSFIVYGFNLAGKVLPGSLMSGNLWVDPVVKLRSALRDKKRIFSFFEGIGIPAEKIVFADHHLCHTYTVMSNPWGITDNALLINIDGAGDGYCSTVNVLEDGAVRNIEKTNAYNSIGLLYSEATQFLNMRPLSHEYKVMGLAAYSREENYRHICRKLSEKYMRINKANPMRFENIAGCTTWGYRKKFKRDFAGERFD
ncbi:MAG: hypothetical protein KAJ10_15280, partial [Thermodesulfovibrionia bacterium]|nr:hypothetical protein [Thermodesulfovibrionia bacterium]